MPLHRQQLRQTLLATRAALDPEQHARQSAAIASRLAAYLDAFPAQVLAFCLPIRHEFDPRPVLLPLLGRGWQLAVPVVTVPHAPMQFRPWSPGAPMTRDRHQIPVPATDEVVAPGIVLVPFLAIDPAGHRLGYGGGYFDRTLASLDPSPHTIGLGFEFGYLPDIAPQPHDIPLDWLITDCRSQPRRS